MEAFKRDWPQINPGQLNPGQPWSAALASGVFVTVYIVARNKECGNDNNTRQFKK
jgi:hypothetical protein